ncbi:6-carboxytetrahydropterin synthase QueD [Paenibacillus sp. FSL W8-0426]|uniref:6-carboxytetrahydropterin synthase QueD n=1 Tax=Paenibacillus sp. FSL W8-0426 TaxID=2921714 RepID=UPI0030DC9CC2
MREPGTFRIVERLQRIDEDILPAQLRYHRKRVLVSKEFTFDAAHHLHCYEGKCKNLHGHTYKVVFGISGYPGETGLTVDFGHIKDIWKTRMEGYLDHQYLNETLPLMNTTAENMVVWLFEQMELALQSEPYVSLAEGGRTEFVRLYETPTSYAEARREWMIDG